MAPSAIEPATSVRPDFLDSDVVMVLPFPGETSESGNSTAASCRVAPLSGHNVVRRRGRSGGSNCSVAQRVPLAVPYLDGGSWSV
jgi:hypothetical protein